MDRKEIIACVAGLKAFAKRAESTNKEHGDTVRCYAERIERALDADHEIDGRTMAVHALV